MSDGRWFDAVVPEIAGLAASLLPSVPATPAALARTVTEQLVGRRLTAKVNGGEARFTLTELDLTGLDRPADSLRLATGRVGDVRLVAQDVDWPTPPGSIPLRRVVVVARDMRLRSVPTPSVTPGSVELDITVPGEIVRKRVARTRPGIVATPHADGFQVRWAKHPSWGRLTLTPAVVDEAVVLTPTTLHIGQREFAAPKRIRPVVLPLSELPDGLRLVGVVPGEDELVLRTVAEEWPQRLSRVPIAELLTWLTTAALTLTVPRFRTR
ncbi:hypothetical protein VSH64_45625 [Amycolatopsis rhabdoformis]|uniref:DUF2993 domain-containing protein n=1 Tax=Amycolatopsis rhabdoformis TaxID=1448059 RepID=A0ABZ1I6I2_9PSEU|nr:hypothetical protein [Amycolatopsis rhabdoformis]WSE29998.1 hypothetical protein VSH64_45625 [Amycolatopsis rhabdoformis]